MINTNGRLFTFGCSVTQYHWPTWADIAGTKWNHFENWGEAGAGNYFIFNSIIECDAINNITPDDTVAIMWTAPARQDFYSVNRWGHTQSIFNTDNLIAHCPDGYWLSTFSYIYAIDQILKNRKIPYTMATWVDYSDSDSKFHQMFENLLSHIQYIPLSLKPILIPKINAIDTLIENLYNSLSGPDWPSLEDIKKNQYSTTPSIQQEIDFFWKALKKDKRIDSAAELDGHPLPSEHLKIANKIFPELDLSTDEEKWNQLDYKITNGEPIEFDKNLPNKNYYREKL